MTEMDSQLREDHKIFIKKSCFLSPVFAYTMIYIIVSRLKEINIFLGVFKQRGRLFFILSQQNSLFPLIVDEVLVSALRNRRSIAVNIQSQIVL